MPVEWLRTPADYRSVEVAAHSRTYTVHIGSGLHGQLVLFLKKSLSVDRAFVVADSALDAFAGTLLLSHGIQTHSSRMEASERNKSLATVERVLRELLAAKHERGHPIISLGGGVITDLAGFVAATYRRGVPVIHCPTTLLAMVDAAIGGKTGVNLELPDGSLAKNMVGAFWQPHLVICDTDTLKTLPPRHLRSGMAECLKHALISAGLPAGQGRDETLWDWTLTHLDKCLALDPAPLADLVARNVAVKAGVVSADEREEAPSTQGGRALLNLGHTFAHAIETLPGVSVRGESDIHHGEAVAYGLISAATASHALGWLSQANVDTVRSAVARLGLAPHLHGLPSNDALIERMSHDKKAAGGKLRLVLLKRLGEACVVEDPPLDAVCAGWDSVRAP